VIADLAGRVRAAPPRCGATRLVCVDGPSGSGKTTLARALKAALDAPVLHLDDLYPGWDGLAASVPLLRDGVVAPLLAGRDATHPAVGLAPLRAPGDTVVVGRPPVLVLDGVGSGARPIAAHAVLLVWVEAPRDERFRRGIARDGETYRPHWERWAAQEAAHFAAEGTRARADVVVDGTAVPV
jgi:uridine kinase